MNSSASRILSLLALAIYLTVGGQSGLCSFLIVLDIEHHHHGHTASASGLPSETADESEVHPHSRPDTCRSDHHSDDAPPVVPCKDQHAGNESDQLVAVTTAGAKAAHPTMVALVPATVFAPLRIALPVCENRAILRGNVVRGSPPPSAARLCRFLV